MIPYALPDHWIRYDGQAITNALAEAKATVLSLKTMPYQRQWVERLQQMELKREVAGTSRIEGADFTERELDEAMKDAPGPLATRSQRQAHAAKQTYVWIASLPDDRPVDAALILDMHRRIVTGADDDHCPPGKLRTHDQNVNFGAPRHRGAEGGEEVERAFARLVEAIQREFRGHDPLVQALAAHYHFAAMHPFLDGNGRTARALEALLLRRAGLRDTAFIAMSNYYYDEKTAYLTALAETRQRGHDLTPFLLLALKAVAVQGGRLLGEIQRELKKELFRSFALRLFGRLLSPRKRVLAQRQMNILNVLLEAGELSHPELTERLVSTYGGIKHWQKAYIRDMEALGKLRAVQVRQGGPAQFWLSVNLDWPTQITETEFLERLKKLPMSKTRSGFTLE
jgi:Fic family protein